MKKQIKQVELSGLLDIRQAAAALNVSVSTIRSWVWQREIETVRVGRAIRFRQEAIADIIQNGITPARAS